MAKQYLHWNNPSDRLLLHESLLKNQVSAGSSDTVIGLLAQVSKQGLEMLNSIKQRKDKPYIILIQSETFLNKIAHVPHNERIVQLMQKCWPGPLTLIFNTKQSSDYEFLPPTIAVRLPAHEGLQALLNDIGAVYSTSANISGHPIPQTIEEIDPIIRASCDYIITDDDQKSNVQVSTILDCTGPDIKLVREGAYSREYLETMCGKEFFQG